MEGIRKTGRGCMNGVFSENRVKFDEIRWKNDDFRKKGKEEVLRKCGRVIST